jgi:hypothetical protein
MNQDYFDLKALEKSAGYQKLQALMIHQVSEIEKARDKAASKGSESAWRYWAGVEKGFKLAMTALPRALAEIEQKDDDLREETSIDKMLEEMKLKGETP